jgi:hypothetical protein
MATLEKDIFSHDFTVGSFVMVRCLVTAITPDLTNAGSFGGAGDSVTCLVETPGNVGEKQNVSFAVSPVQCRHAGAKYQG